MAQIYRKVTLIYKMFFYFSFIDDLSFNVVDHLVGRSMMPSDVAHSNLAGTWPRFIGRLP